ncbi:hypothetical protein L228DRAFT_237267 [Xylona heveae TC161]|uniref:Uncharacterized protein n=1 Tax=Xylona heveae (strain CBS 132557 / TC161) TaxID=1328760 RepID=A0A161TPX8_XYLHT|nr:hypothetical protein L228DRAFT_237267 [Xylona heveae TC161]KZF24326.1 hypothetical protein L228DRAFT_237267 [Xylona heveae TC161]
MSFVVQKLVRGVAGGIGLASESISAYKENKNSKKAQGDTREEPSETGIEYPEDKKEGFNPEDDDPVEEVDDEQQWALDEAQDELTADRSPPPLSKATTEEPSAPDLAEALVRQYPMHELKELEVPPPSYAEASETGASPSKPVSSRPMLPYPVVVPQRRPKARARGFIRAYPPILEEFDIDQKAFLQFIDGANKLALQSQWMQAINLASLATIPLPFGIGVAISIAVQMATDVATEMHGRSRTNSYIAKLNKEFFGPRGLFCLVMTYKPNSADPFALLRTGSGGGSSSNFDLNSTISNTLAGSQETANFMKKLKTNLSASQGKTYGGQLEMLFPETAPLIYPELDKLVQKDDAETLRKRDKLLKGKEFTAKYVDKRATARFIAQNPESALAQNTPTPQFKSRFSDPNHPVNSGSLVSLLTGGYVNPPSLQQRRQARMESAYYGRGGGLGGRRGPGLIGSVISAIGDASANRSSAGGPSSSGPAAGTPAARASSSSRSPGPSSRNYPQSQSQSQSYDPDQPYDRYGYGFGYSYATGNNPDSSRRARRQALRDMRRYRGGPALDQDPAYGGQYGSGGILGFSPIGGVKKLLGQDVLYLMVVNMPTDEEMAEASRVMRS